MVAKQDWYGGKRCDRCGGESFTKKDHHANASREKTVQATWLKILPYRQKHQYTFQNAGLIEGLVTESHR
jgi:hypothetical protein